MTTTQADPATMKARELRLLANRMRRANEPDLARQLDKRAAEVLLDIGGPEHGRKTSRAEAARAWLDVFNESVRLHWSLWTAGVGEVGSGAEWIGARDWDSYIGLYPAWVRRFLREHGYAESVIGAWKRDGWIFVDAGGKTAMLTRGATGRQRMIRLRRDVLAEVEAIRNAEPDR